MNYTKPLIVFLIALTIGLFSSCSDSSSPSNQNSSYPDEFPADFSESFTPSCLENSRDAVEFCDCMVRGIQQEMTYAEYMEVGRNGVIPEAFQEVTDFCTRNNDYYSEL
jgi:hypothetical protein